MIQIEFVKIKWWFFAEHSQEEEEQYKNPEIKSELETKLHHITGRQS
jgi:hypothetical protein